MAYYPEEGAQIPRNCSINRAVERQTDTRQTSADSLINRCEVLLKHSAELESLADRVSGRLFGRNLTDAKEVRAAPEVSRPMAMLEGLDSAMFEASRRVSRTNELLMAILIELGG